MKIKKNDNIKIIIGKDKGKAGKVLSVYTQEKKLLVENLNMFKKHTRPKRQGEKGETIRIARPVDASNVMLVCPACNRATRIGYKFQDKNKIRFCKKCGSGV